MDDEIGEIVSRAEPGEDTVPIPTPGNYLLSRYLRREMPTMFLRVLLDSTLKPIIVPTQDEQNPPSFLPHESAL